MGLSDLEVKNSLKNNSQVCVKQLNIYEHLNSLTEAVTVIKTQKTAHEHVYVNKSG